MKKIFSNYRGFVFWVVVLSLQPIFTVAQSAKKPIEITDLLKIKTAGSLAVSPDGSFVAYTVTAIEQDEKNSFEYNYETQIWLARTDGIGAPRQFTTGKDGARQPVWSPDGQNLVFVRGVNGQPQLFLTSMQGGEPRQLTSLPTGASNPVWSLDCKMIAFTSSIPLRQVYNDSVMNPRKNRLPFSMEKPGLTDGFLQNTSVKPNANGNMEEVRAYLYKNETDNKAKVLNKLNFQQETSTSSDMSVTHVYLMQPQPGATPKMVTKGMLSFANPQFVANSPLLVVERVRLDNLHPDRNLESAIFTMDTLGNSLQMLVGQPGFSCYNVVVAPSGKRIAYQKSIPGDVRIPALFYQDLQPKASPRQVVFDRNKGNVLWSPDEAAIYFTTQTNGGAVLNRYDIKSEKGTSLTLPDKGINDFDLKAGRLVFTQTEIESPSEIYVSDPMALTFSQLTQLNDWVREKHISLPEKHTFKNSLGQEVEYWVMKPAGFEAGKKYPLLLEIHGGPSAMWGPGESSMWHEYQYFCSKGYGVVYCNPRGSGGYGETFLRSNRNDWGAGPMEDVMTALDKTVAQGWADTSRLLVTGGSYAGYLVAYILGHDQRFAAACAQRGVYDLRTFFGEGNAWRLVPNFFGGYPWEPKIQAILERESPINYVENIHTPFIIFHGEQDLRTGVIQSEQLYKSLKVLGRPVEYVRHPGANHEITRTGNNRQRIDQMLRTWEFFERFINEGK